MFFFRQNKLNKRLTILLNRVSADSRFSTYRVEEINELLTQIELVIAFEVLCESIYEFLDEIPSEIYNEIESLADKKNLNVATNRYLFLSKIKK